MAAADKLSILLRDVEDRCERAVSAAEKFSNELRGANDRINQLQALGYAMIVPSRPRNG